MVVTINTEMVEESKLFYFNHVPTFFVCKSSFVEVEGKHFIFKDGPLTDT